MKLKQILGVTLIVAVMVVGLLQLTTEKAYAVGTCNNTNCHTGSHYVDPPGEWQNYCTNPDSPCMCGVNQTTCGVWWPTQGSCDSH